MSRRFVSIGAIPPGLDLALITNEFCKSINPVVEVFKDLRFFRQVLGLIVAIFLPPAEFYVTPELIRNLNPAIAALPHQWGEGVAHLLKRLFIGVKIFRVFENFRTPAFIQFVAAAVAVAIESGGAPF